VDEMAMRTSILSSCHIAVMPSQYLHIAGI